MREWIPVPGSVAGKLVSAALDLFGSVGYADVHVGAIATAAGVTTGPLYHHFGSKAGLYRLVRGDVEQRVLDRMQGAAEGRLMAQISDAAHVLLVGFDYLVRARFARLLGEAVPADTDTTPPRSASADPVEVFIGTLLDDAMTGALIAAAWRSALWHAATGPDAAATARSAFERLLRGT